MSAKAAPKNPKVDGFIAKEKKWRAEFEKMRAIIFDRGMTTEEFKWGHPCYTYQESNILIIQGFKDYCALMFCKGSLLKDPHGLLKAPGRSQAARQLRFTSVEEIAEVLKVSQQTVLRDWKLSKVWLLRELAKREAR